MREEIVAGWLAWCPLEVQDRGTTSVRRDAATKDTIVIESCNGVANHSIPIGNVNTSVTISYLGNHIREQAKEQRKRSTYQMSQLQVPL